MEKKIVIGLILSGLGLGVAYSILNQKPKEVVVTKTVTVETLKYVDRVVLVKNNVVSDKTTTVKAKDGTETVTTEHIIDMSTSQDKSKEEDSQKSEETDKKLTSYASKYTIGVEKTVKPNLVDLTSMPKPEDLRLKLGVRIFSLPILAIIGSNLKFNEFTVGLTLEL